MKTVIIHNTQLPVVEYLGQRVVSLAMIDAVHERPEGTARRNLNEHRQHFRINEDYFELTADEIRTQSLRSVFAARTAKGTLVTQSGYLMLVKSLTDDLAWDVQRQLVNSYFRREQAPSELSRLQILQMALESEQALIKVQAERDHAVATKAEIGNRREATAMATASAAVRKANQLRDELGKGCRQATVTAVEIATGRELGTQGFRPLKRWCDERGISAPYVQDSRFGRVRAWPADAWLAVYKIDLASLFGAEVAA